LGFAEIVAILSAHDYVRSRQKTEGFMENVQTSVVSAWEQVTTFLAVYGLGALGGIVLLVVGWKIARWSSAAVDAALSRTQSTDLTLRRFIASVVRYVILTFTILAVL
jgi:small conductance mechanosensitive channel